MIMVLIYFSFCFLFIMLQAFFGGIETGMVSMRKPRLSNGVKKGDRRALILEFFSNRPSLMLSCTLLGTNISVVCATLTAKQAVTELGFGSEYPLIITSVLLSIILFATDIIPKDWFRQAPYERCIFFAGFYKLTYVILCLPSKLLAKFTDWIIHIMSRSQKKQDAAILIREDFRLFLRESEEGGIMDANDANILDKAVDFYKLTVKDIMIPADEVSVISADSSVQEAVKACAESGRSRLPVKDRDNIWVGIFTIYDAIYKLPEEEWLKTRVTQTMRPLNIISASAGLGEVMLKSKAGRSPMLTVVSPDDHAEQLGIATQLDVVNYLFKR